MDRLTTQEWSALSADEQKVREEEMPWEVFAEKSKTEQERLKNSAIEHDRKLKAAEKQVEELNATVQQIKNAGGSPAQVQSLEDIRKQYLEDLEKDPLMANAKLAATGIARALADFKKADQIKRSALRNLRRDYPKDMNKYGEELEDMLDNITDSSRITADSILIMFNSLRGKSIDDQLKEAREDGAKKALEDAGIVAIDSGGSSGAGGSGKSSLTKEQEEERNRMGLNEADYKEILRGRQEKDRNENRTPRTLINPKH